MSLDRVFQQIKGPDFDRDVNSLAVATKDRGSLKHNTINRPRSYPLNPAVVLNPVAGVGENVFGNYLSLIPRGTFDFGDSPNFLQVLALAFESFSESDTFIIEFYSSEDDETYTPLGNVRAIRTNPLLNSLFIWRPCRDFNCDDGTLYARLKSASGSNNVEISLNVERHVCTAYEVPPSTGTWPTG